MTWEGAIEVLAAINLGAIGLSHTLQPRAWISFYRQVEERGEAGCLVIAMLNLAFGSVVVAFHNVWTGIPAVLTVVGWISLLKALTYLAFPKLALTTIRRALAKSPRLFLIPGIGFMAISALLLINRFT